MRQRVPIAAGVAVLGMLLLTGCDALAGPLPSASASASAGSGGAASASPSASASPAVSIPLDCRNVVDQQTYQATFGDTPLNDPALGPAGEIQPSAAPAGADARQILNAAVQLRCIWRDPRADTTGLIASFARFDPARAAAYLGSLPAEGFECEAKYGGQWCQKISKNPQYPVEDGSTAFLRDDVFIDVQQSNFPTQGLLEKIVTTLWPA